MTIDENTPAVENPVSSESSGTPEDNKVQAQAVQVVDLTPRKKGKPRGKPFAKGDPRINRKGTRLSNFLELRIMAQKIAEQKVENRVDHKMYKAVEVILMQMAISKDPREHQKFLEIAYGPVPQKLEIVPGENGEPLPAMTDQEIADRIVVILGRVRERMAEQSKGEPLG
jgi:hypothetical protein